MKIIYTILLFVGIMALLVLVNHFFDEPLLKPKAIFSALEKGDLQWDSVAAVDDALWITATPRQGKGDLPGQIVILDRAKGTKRPWTGATLALEAPNGIAAVKRKSNGWSVLVTDASRREVIHLNEKGELLGRFGKNVLARPLGVAAYEEETRLHVLVTDVRPTATGKVWHFTLSEGKEPTVKLVTEVEGEVESVMVLPERTRLLVANETRRRLESYLLSGKGKATLGKGAFQGEPEGIQYWPEKGLVVAIDQSVNGRILLGSWDAPFRSIKSTPPMASPDGLCLCKDNLYVVVNNSFVYAFSLADFR